MEINKGSGTCLVCQNPTRKHVLNALDGVCVSCKIDQRTGK